MAKVRVQIFDTDAMGRVFFSRLFDKCIEAFDGHLRNRGSSIKDLVAKAYQLPVVHAELDVVHPIVLGDELDIAVQVEFPGTTAIHVLYEMRLGGALVATAKTIHVVVDAKGKKIAYPPDLVALADS